MWHRATTQHNEQFGGDLAGTTPPEHGLALLTLMPSDSCQARGATEDLRQSLAAFRDAHPVGVYSAKHMIDPLLDLWALAAAVDRTVARPIEAVLVALVDRTVVTARELSRCADQVEATLLRLSP